MLIVPFSLSNAWTKIKLIDNNFYNFIIEFANLVLKKDVIINEAIKLGL
jgi:hypothetical protein